MCRVGFWFRLVLGIVSIYMQDIYSSKLWIKESVCQVISWKVQGQKEVFSSDGRRRPL